MGNIKNHKGWSFLGELITSKDFLENDSICIAICVPDTNIIIPEIDERLVYVCLISSLTRIC